jgi:hypothetical protein
MSDYFEDRVMREQEMRKKMREDRAANPPTHADAPATRQNKRSPNDR